MEISCTEGTLGQESQNAENEGSIFDAEPRKDSKNLVMCFAFWLKYVDFILSILVLLVAMKFIGTLSRCESTKLVAYACFEAIL